MIPPSFRHPGTGLVLLIASAIALNILTPGTARGVSMETTPSIRLEEGWDSNVFNASDNEVSSFGTRVTPSLALKFTTSENSDFQLFGSYEQIWYSNTDAKPAESHTWYFRLDSPRGVQFSPNLSMTPSVYYIDTTNSYRRIQLLPAGDPVLPPVTITNYGNTKTQDFGGAVGFNYLATQNVTIGVNGNYSEQRFSSPTDNAAQSGLTNSATAGGNASVSYQFSPRTQLGILVAGNHQTYTDAPSADTLSGGILMSYQFSEALKFDGVFGISYIKQSSAPGVPEQSKSAPSGLIAFTYIERTFTGRLYGSAVYSAQSGFGQATRQWTAGVDMFDQFTREWSWNLSGAYQLSRSVFVSEAVDLDSTYGTAGISYKPWDWGSLDLTGSFNRQTSTGQLGSTIDTYSAILGLTIGKSYKTF